MQFTIPANYDQAILADLKAAGAFEVYGKLPADIAGGGRPTYMASPLSKKQLSAYIKAAHGAGLEFNYLLNAACFGNAEWTGSFHRQFNKLMEWLEDQQVETVTVAAPYLAQVVRKRFPRFKIKAGIYAQIDTVKRAQYWEDLGAETINLESFSMNRDFEKLEAIRKAVKCDLVLIANHFCRPNCPYQVQHQNGHAHASLKKSTFFVEFPLIQCQKNRLMHKEFFISAPWIRPEDLKHYEAMGYTTFKLLERNIPSSALLERVRAYQARSYEGNLADLLLSWGFKKQPPRFSWPFLLKHFHFWKMPLGLAGTALEFLKGQGIFFTQQKNPITIDTRAIPEDFIERFKKGSCADRDCNSCGYCKKIADKAVSIDPAFLDKMLPVYNELEASLVSGRAWNLRKA